MKRLHLEGKFQIHTAKVGALRNNQDKPVFYAWLTGALSLQNCCWKEALKTAFEEVEVITCTAHKNPKY